MCSSDLSETSIHKERQVEVEEIEDHSKITEEIIQFNSKVWNEKKTKELSLKDSISMEIPDNLTEFKKDFQSMHNLEF